MSYLYHKNETIQYMYFISLIKKIYIYIYIYTKPVKMSSINISQEWSFKAFLTARNNDPLLILKQHRIDLILYTGFFSASVNLPFHTCKQICPHFQLPQSQFCLWNYSLLLILSHLNLLTCEWEERGKNKMGSKISLYTVITDIAASFSVDKS